MSKTISIIAFCAALALPSVAFAQGTVRGAAEGADAGDRAAGPVGGVVGGAVGAATGTVGGVLGADGRPARRGGCETSQVHRENAEGDSETKTRTDC